MDSNHDIVPTLRMFNGLIMGQAADEIERLREKLKNPKKIVYENIEGKKIKINVTVEVPENWSNRLDMQSILENEIHADRWSWDFIDTKKQAE